MLALWGHPEQSLAFVHVAGTNGKGTTTQIIARALTLSGYVTGCFTSPHMVSYTERVTIDNQPIKPERFLAYLDELESLLSYPDPDASDLPTEFELLTAIAFKYFADNRVDFAVAEVGLGGTFDATNVIVPRVSVITGIDYDHMAFLGNTLAEIAANKAGIIKYKVPVVIGRLSGAAAEVIAERAQALQAPLISSESVSIEMLQSQLSGQMLRVYGYDNDGWRCFYRLPGPYQRENLATALTVLQALRQAGVNIADHAVRETLQQVWLPGRMEKLSDQPLTVADVAHNPQGVKALTAALEEILPDKRKVLLTAILDDKDKVSMLTQLGKNTALAVFTKPVGNRGRDWQRTAQLWHELYPDIPAVIAEDIMDALSQAKRAAAQADYLLITGSFYLMAPVWQYFHATASEGVYTEGV